MSVGEGVESRVDELGLGLGVLQFLEFRHALVVVQPVRFHFRHRLPPELVELTVQDGARVLEDALDQREEVQGVGVRGRVEQWDRLVQVERQRLVHGEVCLELDVDPHARARVRVWYEFHDLARQE